MKDRDFLIWMHTRLTDVYKERPTFDYMHKLRAIIKATPAEKETPNTIVSNSIKDLIEELGISNQPFKTDGENRCECGDPLPRTCPKCQRLWES